MYYMKHILLIDDNDIDNYVSKQIIKKNGICDKVTVKNSALNAIDFLKSIQDDPAEYPDLILLDLKMPVMDGFEFLEVYVTLSQSLIAFATIYMLTSSSDVTDVERAKSFLVIKKYLNKPLCKEYFENEIQ